MAIFPHLISEKKVQVDDKTRLDATKSFVTVDEAAISLLRIKPSTSDSFIDVTVNKYLDWAYTLGGTKTVTVEVTTDAAGNGLPEITEIETVDDVLTGGGGGAPEITEYTFPDDSFGSYNDTYFIHRTPNYPDGWVAYFNVDGTGNGAPGVSPDEIEINIVENELGDDIATIVQAEFFDLLATISEVDGSGSGDSIVGSNLNDGDVADSDDNGSGCPVNINTIQQGSLGGGGGSPAVQEITEVTCTNDDSLGGGPIVWDTLTAGATDDGNGGISGGGAGVADLSKSSQSGYGGADDFLFTYHVDGFAIPNDFFIGLSDNDLVDDFGTFSGFILSSGGGNATLVYDNGNEGNGPITLSSDNVFELERIGSDFELRIDGLVVFSTNLASSDDAFPMVRLKGQNGVVFASESTNFQGGAGLNSNYWEYSSPNDDFYVWYNVDNNGGDPNIPGRIPIEVSITAGESAGGVAQATEDEIGIQGDGSVQTVVNAEVITLENNDGGEANDATPGNTQFQINILQQGENEIVAPPAGSSLDGTYFIINTDTDEWYVWLDVNGNGNDPDPLGNPAFGISVFINPEEVADDVAASVHGAIDGNANFTGVSLLGNILQIQTVVLADVPDSYDANTGFTISTPQQGVAGNGPCISTRSFPIEVLTEVDDCLFSDDSMLVEYEGEILKYVRKGRFSWLDKHRAAQERIIEFLDENEIWKLPTNNTTPIPYTKIDICALTGDDFEQFKDWSRFMVLEMIYFDMKKQVDDSFTEKFIHYKRKRVAASNRSVLRLDKNGNGTITADEFEFKNQGRIIRR